ncbi:MAG TPA: T9SS type A sorting domain-containing protein, partial [Rhodothermales bacterium]|nr:T9SS type A sorting domain-containing protein [Rhodothermales bacterium]
VYVELPEQYHLSAPYPNPFNPSTHFTVMVAREQHVRIEVMDVQGRRVSLLHTGVLPTHEMHDFTFEAHHLPTGVYVIRTRGETFATTRTLVLVR